MEDNKKLVLSFLHFLDDQQRSSALNNDDIESLDGKPILKLKFNLLNLKYFINF